VFSSFSPLPSSPLVLIKDEEKNDGKTIVHDLLSLTYLQKNCLRKEERKKEN